ncbi:IS3 family transposase [Halomonas sp. HK25]
MARIQAIHAWSDGTYGVSRIHAKLVDEGWRVGPSGSPASCI